MADQKPETGAAPAPIVIKKYANRRLYNTSTSAYVTLEHLSEMVHQGLDFIVQDAKSGEDITRAVLTQIIFEQESRGQSLLPVQFLRRLIRFYGHSMQSFLPAYLEMSIERFASAQDQWREQMAKAWGVKPAAFEDQARANLAMFDQAMRLWAPFSGQLTFVPPDADAPAPLSPTPEAAPTGGGEPLNEMKKQLEAMQKQIDALSATRKP
jgi:polyhydroxyalkanoate synthesis repressor PhaR